MELGDFFANPVGLGILAIVAGFAIVALAKIYGLFFMRWKTPFRVGEAMHVRRAEVVDWDGDEGHVRAGGELWRATSADALSAGEAVVIKSVDGLTLRVRKKN
jgi:membrane-bound serine protease (ClpP class)